MACFRYRKPSEQQFAPNTLSRKILTLSTLCHGGALSKAASFCSKITEKTRVALLAQSNLLLADVRDLMNQISQALSETDKVIADKLDDTAHLPDGTAVFLKPDGSLCTKDGRILKAAEADTVTGRDDIRRFEDWEALNNKRDRLQGHMDISRPDPTLSRLG